MRPFQPTVVRGFYRRGKRGRGAREREGEVVSWAVREGRRAAAPSSASAGEVAPRCTSIGRGRTSASQPTRRFAEKGRESSGHAQVGPHDNDETGQRVAELLQPPGVLERLRGPVQQEPPHERGSAPGQPSELVLSRQGDQRGDERTHEWIEQGPMMMSRRESVRLMQAAASARPLAIVASASLVIWEEQRRAESRPSAPELHEGEQRTREGRTAISCLSSWGGTSGS